jgi:type II secretory pathway pseudopilin PulG
MAQFVPQSVHIPGLLNQANGFILLEVLVAMSLVTTSWIVLGNTYQQMVLRLGQLQEQRAQMKQVLDQHELALLTMAQSKNLSHHPRKSLNESSRMSRRSGPISSISGASKKK